MELCLCHNKINEDNIIFESIESNKVIREGYFLKLSHKMFYNINISSNWLKLPTPTKLIYNTKRNIKLHYLFVKNNEENKDFIDFVKKYDTFFENKTKEFLTKKKIKCKNLSYVGMTRHTDLDGIIFRIPIHENEYQFSNEPDHSYRIILRWNGIWISETQYGLNYKILRIFSKKTPKKQISNLKDLEELIQENEIIRNLN